MTKQTEHANPASDRPALGVSDEKYEIELAPVADAEAGPLTRIKALDMATRAIYEAEDLEFDPRGLAERLFRIYDRVR